MTKDKAQKKSKKWSKIWVLNWLTIGTFLVTLSIIGAEEVLTFISKFDKNIDFSSGWNVINLETWRPVHFLCLASFAFLMIEQVALLKTKRIDMLETAKEAEQLVGNHKKQGGPK